MKRCLPAAFLICTLFAGCTKQAKQAIINNHFNNTPPTAFNVKVVDREDTYAIIQWSRSVSNDSTLVTYTVTVNGIKISSELTDTTYKILNLVDSLAYNGKIIATDRRGAMVTDTFTIHKAPGIMYASTASNFTCYTLGGDQRWTVPGVLTSYPVISNDTVFAQGINIYALNSKTGVKYWKYTGSEIGGGLVYYGGILFTNLPQANKILAINATSGNLVWELSGGGAYPPTISRGILYYENPDGFGGAAFIAIDAKTGTPKWDLKLPGQTAIPVAVNGTAFIQSTSTDQSSSATGYLYALNATTGVHKWTFSYTGSVGVNYQSRPVVIGNIIYFLAYQNEYGSPNTLYAVNVSDGTLKWQCQAFSGADYGTVFGGPDGIYVNTYQKVEKFDLNTGALLWNDPDNSDLGDVSVSPGNLYFRVRANPTSYVQPYNSSTGVVVNTSQTVPDVGGYIIALYGKIYYPYSSGMNSTN